MMKKFTLRNIVLLMLCAVGFVFSSCSDDDCDCPEVKPTIADRLLGKWVCDNAYIWEDGEWVNIDDLIEPDERLIVVRPMSQFEFRKDRKFVTKYDYDNWVASKAGTWGIDEVTKTLYVSADGIAAPATISRLDNNVLELFFGMEERIPRKMIYNRIKTAPAKTLYDQVLGKWNYLGVYEKTDGEWVAVESGVPDELSLIFTEDGMLTAYFSYDGAVSEWDDDWQINIVTGALGVGYSEDEGVITMDGDNRMELEVAEFYDFSVDVTRDGEFKWVYERVE